MCARVKILKVSLFKVSFVMFTNFNFNLLPQKLMLT